MLCLSITKAKKRNEYYGLRYPINASSKLKYEKIVDLSITYLRHFTVNQ